MNKTIVTILMFVFVATTIANGFLRFGGTYVQATLGTITTVLLVVRLFMQRRWMQHAGEAVKSGKAGDHTKRAYLLSILLFKLWFLTALSGVLSFLRHIGYTTAFEGIGSVHGITAISSTVLLTVYVINHFYNEKLYKERQKATNL